MTLGNGNFHRFLQLASLMIERREPVIVRGGTTLVGRGHKVNEDGTVTRVPRTEVSLSRVRLVQASDDKRGQ